MKPLNGSPSNVPEALRKLANWVCHVNGRPINPITGKYASSTDPETWCEFATAWNRRKQYDGVSFALTLEAGIVGVDIDKCRNPKTGKLSAKAAQIAKLLDSYTEVSPSGTGIRIFVFGTIPRSRHNSKTGVEVYNRAKFLTVTGKRLEGYSK